MLDTYIYEFRITPGHGEYARNWFIDTYKESKYLKVSNLYKKDDVECFDVKIISDFSVAYSHKLSFDAFIRHLHRCHIDAYYVGKPGYDLYSRYVYLMNKIKEFL